MRSPAEDFLRFRAELILPTAHSGQSQSSGTSSHGVPGATPILRVADGRVIDIAADIADILS